MTVVGRVSDLPEGTHRIVSVDGRDTSAPTTASTQSFDLDRERHLVTGADDPAEANVFDAAEQRE